MNSNAAIKTFTAFLVGLFLSTQPLYSRDSNSQRESYESALNVFNFLTFFTLNKDFSDGPEEVRTQAEKKVLRPSAADNSQAPKAEKLCKRLAIRFGKKNSLNNQEITVNYSDNTSNQGICALTTTNTTDSTRKIWSCNIGNFQNSSKNILKITGNLLGVYYMHSYEQKDLKDEKESRSLSEVFLKYIKNYESKNKIRVNSLIFENVVFPVDSSNCSLKGLNFNR